jgi:hypothetical protein
MAVTEEEDAKPFILKSKADQPSLKRSGQRFLKTEVKD